MDKNKKVVVICLILIVIIVGISAWLYLDKKENERIDAEAVTLKEDRNVEFGKEVHVSDFLENLNGTLVNDYVINTEQLGEKTIEFEYINVKNKKRKKQYNINIIDVNSPRILCGASYTLKKGKDKKLEEVLLSGDDIDDNPKREIIGEYDINEVGDYNLTYVVTDSSNNQTKKDIVLHVVENTESASTSKPEPNYLDDIIDEYKTNQTQIGIDVSKWQGEIEWQKVKEAGVEFAIIRVGYQKGYDEEWLLDPYFEANIKGASEAGIPIGLYFYSYAKTKDEGIKQAQWVKEQIKDYDIALPIAFDWESWSSFNKTGMSFYTINKIANLFLDTLEEDGYKGMLYGSKNYLNDIWYPTKHTTWLANYTSKTTYKGEYSIWQMSENGRVDGIKGNVDLNIMYLDRI